MRYKNERDYDHSRAENIGVLLANLGTPDAPTTKAVRKYLRQFLSDPRVVEAPRLLWQVILNGWILPTRSPKTAAAYKKIWRADGSPLLTISRQQRDALQQTFNDEPVTVALGMRYGQPSIASALNSLRAQNCRRIAVLPLYPQYAASTVGSVFDAVAEELRRWRFVPPLRIIGGYCGEQQYTAALAQSIAAHRQEHGEADLLLFSFHGTPLEMLLSGDPYHCQCRQTARLAAEHLRLPQKKWRVTFQSRFGGMEWLKPYTDETLRALPGEGIKKVQIVCPAFSADCLETLEEIAQENRDIFMQAGGEEYSYIPALNDGAAHIQFLRALLQNEIGDWLNQTREANKQQTRTMRKTRADELNN